MREGEESVVPVRAEGAGSRAAAQGRGRRARAIVEKGAGPALAKSCLRSTTPPVLPRWAGHRLGSRALACWGWGTRKGSPACGFGARQGGGVKSAFLRLLGIRLAGGAVRNGDATPPGRPPPPPGFRLLGK